MQIMKRQRALNYLFALNLLPGLAVFSQEAARVPPTAEKVWRERKTAEAQPSATPTPEATPTPPTYSESRPAPVFVPRCAQDGAQSDAKKALGQARSIFIRSKAPNARAHEIENALLKRPKFAALKILLTRNEGEADLVLELGHKYLTTRFFFTVVEPCNNFVVASGSVSSLFSTVDGKVAGSLIKQIRKARQ